MPLLHCLVGLASDTLFAHENCSTQLQQSAFLDLMDGRTYATERSSNFTYLKTPPTSIVQHHTNTAPKFPFAQIARFPWFFSCLQPAYSTRPATSQRLLACLLSFTKREARRFANGVLACFSTFPAKIHYITISRCEESSSRIACLFQPLSPTCLLACLLAGRRSISPLHTFDTRRHDSIRDLGLSYLDPRSFLLPLGGTGVGDCSHAIWVWVGISRMVWLGFALTLPH